MLRTARALFEVQAADQVTMHELTLRSGRVTTFTLPRELHAGPQSAAPAALTAVRDGFGATGTDVGSALPSALASSDPQSGVAKPVLSAPGNGTGVAYVTPYNRDGEQHAWT